MSCPQIWKIEKEQVGRQASEAQQEKELDQERKNKGDIFGWRNNMKFCTCGEKMRNQGRPGFLGIGYTGAF